MEPTHEYSKEICGRVVDNNRPGSSNEAASQWSFLALFRCGGFVVQWLLFVTPALVSVVAPKEYHTSAVAHLRFPPMFLEPVVCLSCSHNFNKKFGLSGRAFVYVYEGHTCLVSIDHHVPKR